MPLRTFSKRTCFLASVSASPMVAMSCVGGHGPQACHFDTPSSPRRWDEPHVAENELRAAPNVRCQISATFSTNALILESGQPCRGGGVEATGHPW